MEFALGAAKIAVIVSISYLAIAAISSHFGMRQWFNARRRLLLVLLSAALVAIKVSEEALTAESAGLDRAMLLWLHAHASPVATRAAGLVTFTGSWKMLVPLEILCASGLLLMRRRCEALYLAACSLAGVLASAILKSVIGRERPTLWEHDEYWGSSFPSGHTLNTACCAGAIAVCVARVWPRAGRAAAVLAVVWVLLVALSRMVVGVHWPADVAAAASLGLVLTSVLTVLLKDRPCGQPSLDMPDQKTP